MRHILRAFVAWLDRRFPEKVVVTTEQYIRYGATINAVAEQVAKHEERIKALETQMANTQLALGFSSPKMGVLER